MLATSSLINTGFHNHNHCTASVVKQSSNDLKVLRYQSSGNLYLWRICVYSLSSFNKPHFIRDRLDLQFKC
ncbi:hypothetical protein J5N97_008055 [Dioscorea zingiberensis]|uniref:Uncharacterized protein n=1 Tax=Dioscorea zingiberensis TaxID=325984 RepID=A0A9D5DDV7_9LILI|nr:hypothetical protein J5N97_008055 [Dioscorea zingiberensis]